MKIESAIMLKRQKHLLIVSKAHKQEDIHGKDDYSKYRFQRYFEQRSFQRYIFVEGNKKKPIFEKKEKIQSSFDLKKILIFEEIFNLDPMICLRYKDSLYIFHSKIQKIWRYFESISKDTKIMRFWKYFKI